MQAQEILNKLRSLTDKLGQSHLVKGLNSEEEARTLLEALAKLPADLLQKQRETLQPRSADSSSIQPYNDYILRSAIEIKPQHNLLGKVGYILLAGGQGTRLGWKGPKALFPLFPENGKTLLDLHIENLRKSSSNLPIAIMCSPLNVDAIRAQLSPSENIELFVQDLLPLLDPLGNWFLEGPGKLCQGPDGNGRVFHYLQRAGILPRWQKLGIEHIAILPIDNPLASRIDPTFIDFHYRCGCDVTTACILRDDPFEKVGVLARQDDRPCVVEYSEIGHAERVAQQADGSLVYSLANINIFLFRMRLAKKLVDKDFLWHVAKKRASCFHASDCSIEEISAAKLETFLFDALGETVRMPALVYKREEIYAPLKNATGEKSPETVRKSISRISVDR